MRKPAWIGDVTPDIEAIVGGRGWGDLDEASWSAIERIVMARTEIVAVEIAGVDAVRGARAQVRALQRHRLWRAQRAYVDADNGVLDWSEREREPELPAIEIGRRNDQGVIEGRLSLRQERVEVTRDGTAVEVFRPRKTPTGQRQGRRPDRPDEIRRDLREAWARLHARGISGRSLSRAVVAQEAGHALAVVRAYLPGDAWSAYQDGGYVPEP